MNVAQLALSKFLNLINRISRDQYMFTPPFCHSESSGGVIGGYSKYVNSFKSLAYDCIQYRARELNNVNWQFKLKTSQKESDVLPLEHWLVELFSNPNPIYTRQEMFNRMLYWYDVDGNVFIYVPKNKHEGKAIPRQFWVLVSPLVTIKWNETGIEHYRYNYGGKEFFIEPDEILHIMNFYPSANGDSEHIGVSIVDSLIDELISDNELSKYTKRYLRNDGMSKQVVAVDQTMDQGQWDLFKAGWNNALPNNPLVGLLQRGMKVEPLSSTGISGKTSTIDSMNSIISRRISSRFGIPFSWTLENAANYATDKNQMFRFITNTIEPIANLWAEKFSQYFSRFEPNLLIDFKKTLWIDEDNERKDIELNFSLGLSTINQLLESKGQEPIGTDGDVRFIKQGLNPIDRILRPPKIDNPFEEEPEPEEEKPKEEKEKEEKMNLIQHVLVNKFYTYKQKSLSAAESYLLDNLDDFFTELKKHVLANIKQSKSYEQKEIDLSTVLTFAEFEKIFKRTMSEPMSRLVIQFFKTATSDIGFDWHDVETDLSKEVKATVKMSAGKIITIKDALIPDLIDNLKEVRQKPIGEIQDTVNNYFKDYEKDGYKAKRIAQTTSTAANGKSQQMVYAKYDVEYTWLTERDGKVRKSHQRLDGTKIDKNRNFNTEDESGEKLSVPHPGGFDLPGEDINCRCVLRPRRINL